MTEAEARARLEAMVAKTSEPTLSDEEVDELVTLARRPDQYGTDVNVTGWVETWDLNAAAAEGWRRKAGKVAGEFDFSIGAGSYSRSQAYAMCLDQAKTYAKKIIGSASMGPHPWPVDTEYVVGNHAE